MALFPAYQPRYTDDLFDVMDELGVPGWNNLTNRRSLVNLAAASKDCEIQNTDKEFRVNLDLQHYSPEEVKITSDDHRIIVNAKHEEKQDNHGFVSREVTRVFTLPENTDPRSVTSTMNSRGRLAIRVQKRAQEPAKEVKIPVEFKK